MGRALIFLITVVVFSSYIIVCGMMWGERTQVRLETKADYVLPSRYSRILSFGNKGLLADFQFLRLTTFLGGRSLLGKKLSDEDWHYFISSVDSITDLDPYFVDPYFLSEGFLTWEAGKISDANRLLAKGVKYRDWDWRLPYFVGFNYFYFQKDYKAGADYIMKAAKIPGAPSFLPTLAARLAYYGGKSRTAILFIKGMLAETSDIGLRKILTLRLKALESAELIENAVQNFKEDHGRLPKSHELVDLGYLKELPQDPYGGKWVILENGRVFSTSKFVMGIPNKK